MQRYEHWAHRLFPKFPFADVVDQVENLGNKKLVQVRQGKSCFEFPERVLKQVVYMMLTFVRFWYRNQDELAPV